MIPARTVAAVTGLLLVGVSLTAQPPTFRSGVELVTIDTRVLDAEGRPLVGLGRDDFRLTVDGQPREIESVSFVEAPAPGATALPDSSANTAGRDGQIVLLVVDRTGIRRGLGHQAMEGLTGFVKGLSPADRAGLYTFPEGGPAVDFTSDRRALVEALSRVRGLDDGPESPFVTMTLSEALRVVNGDRPTLDEVVSRNCMALINPDSAENRPIEVCTQQVRREAQALIQNARHRNESLLARLERLLESLRFIEGRKVLVFVSEGLVFDSQLQGRLRAFSSAVAGLSTAFYAVQIFASQTELTTGRGTAPDWDADRHLRAEGLSLVTTMSGGALFRPGPQPRAIFERIGRELSARYVIAFRASETERDGRSHAIGVRLARADRRSEVRHRTEFTIRPSGFRPHEPETLAAALSEPLPVAALPLRVGAFSVPDGPAGAPRLKVLLGAEIGSPGDPVTTAEAAFEILDASGRRVAHLDAPVPASDAMPLRYTTAVRLAPGRYRVKFAAKDATGRLGSVEHPFEAGESASSLDLSVSSLMLFAGASGSSSAAPALAFDLPESRPAFSAFLLARGSDADAWAQTTAALEVADAKGFTRHHRPMAVAAGSTPDERSFAADVTAERWGPGDYVATVTLTREGKTVAAVSRAFRILNAPSSSDTAPTTAVAAPAPASVDAALLKRATSYVLEHADRAASVVAEERYVQAVVDTSAGETPPNLEDLIAWRDDPARLRRGHRVAERRQLRSDLLMVRTSNGWYTNYRDVAEVDGRAIRDRTTRAVTLFTAGGDPGAARLRRVAEESARYNLGNLRRTINTPTLPLFALHPAHVARFTFDGVGREVVDGVDATVVQFRERLAPTFIVTDRGDYIFIAGRLWLAADGRVVKTSLTVEGRNAGGRAAIDVVYRPVETLGVLMPAEMREHYSNLPGDPGRVIEGRATYANFRRFTVTTDEQVR